MLLFWPQEEKLPRYASLIFQMFPAMDSNKILTGLRWLQVESGVCSKL